MTPEALELLEVQLAAAFLRELLCDDDDQEQEQDQDDE